MDDATAREHALRHAEAVQRGDLPAAGRDLTRAAGADAPAVMAALPDPVTSVEIVSQEAVGDGWVIHIAYGGHDGAVVVESVWAVIDGRPRVTGLSLL